MDCAELCPLCVGGEGFFLVGFFAGFLVVDTGG